jgi:replication initiator protein RepSA
MARGRLGTAAMAASRTKNKTYLGARYHRLVPRLGKKKAIVAVEHSLLTAVWHMLTHDVDYRRAARDAIHFPALLDRFWQNTQRCVGWDVQYFGTVEPQRRGAPHFHAAIQGAIPRAELRAINAATYRQVWWPAHGQLVYEGERLPVWGHPSQGLHRSRDRPGAFELGAGV